MYKTLADAQVYDSRYGAGTTEIWYAKNPTFRADPFHGDETHALVGTIDETNPEEIWAMMQGEAWSPKGEARNLIGNLGLQHTSMSVGDALVMGDDIYIVDRTGFKKVEGQ